MKEMINKNDKNNKFLTAKDASQKLGIPLSTLYRLSRNGSIKSMHIGNRWYYPESEIEEYLSCEILNRYYPVRISEPPERRSYPRMNCNMECYYSIDLPEKNGIFEGVIKNISGGGILLYDGYHADDIKLEDPIKLEFRLDADTIIKTNGRVVRKATNGCGIKFRDRNKEYKNLVIQFVG